MSRVGISKAHIRRYPKREIFPNISAINLLLYSCKYFPHFLLIWNILAPQILSPATAEDGKDCNFIFILVQYCCDINIAQLLVCSEKCQKTKVFKIKQFLMLTL